MQEKAGGQGSIYKKAGSQLSLELKRAARCVKVLAGAAQTQHSTFKLPVLSWLGRVAFAFADSGPLPLSPLLSISQSIASLPAIHSFPAVHATVHK